jgi:Mn2+/Fe2+ NRAMP family transporter
LAFIDPYYKVPVIRRHYSKRALYSIVGLLLIANTINLGADLGAMADSARLILNLPYYLYVCAFGLIAIMLEVLVPYKRYAPMLKLLTVSLLAYFLTGLIATRSWSAVLRATFVPHIRFDFQFLMIIVGVLGTTISPYCFFWQASQEVEEKRGKGNAPGITGSLLEDARTDTAFGMIFSEVAAWFMIETTAVVLYPNGARNINTSAQAASALEPLVKSFAHAGKISEVLFALGIIGTGALAVPIFAASSSYALCELFGWEESLALRPSEAPGFYWTMLAGTTLGVLLNYVGIDPIKALIYTAVINGLIAVPIIFMLIRIANNKKIMGKYTSGKLSNLFSVATFTLMALAAVLMLYTFLLK